MATKADIAGLLADLGVEVQEKKATKAELEEMLKEAQAKAEPVNKLVIPEERVTSKYEHEQELIDQGYELMEDNLDKSKTWLIREVQKLGVPTTYVSKMLGAHYSFCHTVVKQAGMDIVEKRTKSDEMREMFAQEMTVSQVSKALGAHYSYVHGVYKRWVAGGRK